ncbi:hypothetical protein ACS5PU_20065 [Pedobacter sp. GSP4]|uniref:hypothetical protein n=1 Tax=Pedobacter sp. GSP4 TaxID=3453716 RepID=UPI003EEA5DB0
MKNIFGILLLGLLAAKFCAFSISIFLSSTHPTAIEKSSEEHKDKEEESFDKAKKKLLIYETSKTEGLSSLLTNSASGNKYAYRFSTCSVPAKNVPTPPPNLLS